MFALASIARAPSDLREEYAHIILKCCPSETTRQALEDLMRTTFKSPFFDAMRAEFRAEGLAEGRAEGRVKQAANTLFAVLAARRITVPGQVRAVVSACTDPDQIMEWTSRAATASTLDEVFSA